jgi:hypothetical protein
MHILWWISAASRHLNSRTPKTGMRPPDRHGIGQIRHGPKSLQFFYHTIQFRIDTARHIIKAVAPELHASSSWMVGAGNPSLIYTDDHGRIRTAMQFALRGAPWTPGRIGQRTSPISRDSIADSIAYAAEHPEGIAPERFVHNLFTSASSIFGRHELRELPAAWGCWIGGRRHGRNCG